MEWTITHTVVAAFVPWVNFTLLAVLAVLAIAAAVRAIIHHKPQRILLTLLAVDFSFVAVFIFFNSTRPDLKPDVWWMDIQWGQLAYWPLYTAMVVAYLGYHATFNGDVDEETRRIIEKVSEDDTV